MKSQNYPLISRFDLNQLIASKNHIRQNVFRFTRWSNKSYALFNAIGRIIHIGCLSTIIQKLVTVKSMVVQGFLNHVEASESSDLEEEQNDLDFHEMAASTELVAVFPAPSFNIKCDVSGSEVSVLYEYTNIVEAFLGPFFMAKNSSVNSGIMDFNAFYQPIL